MSRREDESWKAIGAFVIVCDILLAALIASDRVLKAVSTKSYGSDEGTIEIICSVNSGLGILYPP
jgi:hypothetical protein